MITVNLQIGIMAKKKGANQRQDCEKLEKNTANLRRLENDRVTFVVGPSRLGLCH